MSHFFAYLSRMKYIQRWSLMRSVVPENIQEHSLQVAVIAHSLAIIRNKLFGGDVDPDRIAVLAMYHDMSEVITGDLPTPIKYFSPDIKIAYKEIEETAVTRLLNLLPEEMKDDYFSLVMDAEEPVAHLQLVKAADKLSAYIKCVEELSAGNSDFSQAEKIIGKNLREMGLPEVDYFMEKFIPSFSLTLDEMSQ